MIKINIGIFVIQFTKIGSCGKRASALTLSNQTSDRLRCYKVNAKFRPEYANELHTADDTVDPGHLPECAQCLVEMCHDLQNKQFIVAQL